MDRSASPRLFPALLLSLLAVSPAVVAQSRQGGRAFAGGVPSEAAPAGVLDLSLEDAIARGLERNLGLLLAAHDVDRARAVRLFDRSELLPRVSASVSESSQQINLEAFGFSFPGAPAIVGPFGLFDARLSLSWALLDSAAFSQAHHGAATLAAAQLSYEDARDLLALAVVEQYLRVLGGESLVAAVEAEVRTSETLSRMAEDRNRAGLVAGIEVLRAQVRLAQDRQRLIGSRNDLDKQMLALARMIGLPLGQEVRLTDTMEESPAPSPELEAAVAEAWARRRDLRAAESRLEAARGAKHAAVRERVPALRLQGNYGALGPTAENARETFDVAAVLHVPLFEGGGLRADEVRTEAELRSREAEVEDLRGGIYYEVRETLLDLEASAEQVEVSRAGLDLARRQLEQARNRFAAGVASNLEVVEAQESLARAQRSRIASLYGFTRDRARLTRATGGGVDALTGLLDGTE